MQTITVVAGSPLPPDAVAWLEANGFLSSLCPLPARESTSRNSSGLTPLTAVQGQIFTALTRRPLNANQTELLAIYWRAWRDGEAAVSVEKAAERLAAKLDIDSERAADYVRGALRSFGRRLLASLDRPPLRIGSDRRGEGVADKIPLLALFSIETGPSGEARHRLTEDGAAAVALALGLTGTGQAAAGHHTGDPALDDPDAVVGVGMTRLAAALLFRVQQKLGLSLDDTVKTLTAQAGAG